MANDILQETLRTLRAEVPVSATLHVWLKATGTEAPGRMAFLLGGDKIGEVEVGNAEEYVFRTFVANSGGDLSCVYDTATTAVSVAYFFNAAEVVDKGITVMHTSVANAPAPVPHGYHFRPPFGWMNDPNGFGRFGGRPHLFYQHYSHGLRWNTMHWGHAISTDYIHWHHMPIFLFPSEDLTARPDRRGGAFSGSAIPLENDAGIRVFFTEQVSERIPETQIQLTATSHNIITASEAEVILPMRPSGLGLTLDFRDPYVVKGPDGLWKMVLGSLSHQGGVILLYETDDPSAAGGWRFAGTLLLEERFGTAVIECPCLIPLDGPADGPATRWGLIYGLMNSLEKRTGRKNLTLIAVGKFDGVRFHTEFEQELDFGTDNYAFQAFVDQDRAVGIGWLANWADVSHTIDFPTAMTLPRNLLLQGNAVLTPPVQAVETLRAGLLDKTRLMAGEAVSLDNGAVEIVIELTESGGAFELAFDHPLAALSVVLTKEGLSIGYALPEEEGGPAYIASGARPQHLRIFLDIGSIEVFADGGRWAGTKRIEGFEPVRSARFSSGTGAIRSAHIHALKLNRAA
ncbi:glycoside hydrolase family 32 protein [Pararhizobium sp. BT-229]|uniref:glycoside hydrolase family 32 protein n=1 Tax=Pararhizobium sp. BT-229 TaxID=2986923 RepID=UPI0021F7265D|nr:glycoside hydrolase family 32 protein [Pararhizobium sp. BT-229]MCV9965369.1 glycoside hydrolase family 32 protein [Pararhizobium sp. BT-229]